jgi:hypothetical protein
MHNTVRAHLETGNTTGVWRPHGTPNVSERSSRTLSASGSPGKRHCKVRYRPAFVYMSLEQSVDLKFLTILRNFAYPSHIRVSLSTRPCNFQSQSCVTASKPRLVFPNVTRITCSTLVLCGRVPFTGPIAPVPHSRSTLLRVSKLGHSSSSSSSSSRRIQTYSTLTCADCQMSFC